jgi:hypothetical protein
MPLGIRVDVDTAGITVALNELQTRSASLKAVRAGIKIVQSAAKSAAPKRGGDLRRAQGIKAVKGKKGKTTSFAVQGAKTAYVRFRKGRKIKPSKYDHLVIGGAKAHFMPYRKGFGVLKSQAGVKKMHPGARANPYRARAYAGVKSAVADTVMLAMAGETRKILDKATAKTLSQLSGGK